MRFRSPQSRLKGQGCAGDSLDETDIPIENAAVHRPADEFHFEGQIRARQSQLKCPKGHFSLIQAIEFERRASPTLKCRSTPGLEAAKLTAGSTLTGMRACSSAMGPIVAIVRRGGIPSAVASQSFAAPIFYAGAVSDFKQNSELPPEKAR